MFLTTALLIISTALQIAKEQKIEISVAVVDGH